MTWCSSISFYQTGFPPFLSIVSKLNQVTTIWLQMWLLFSYKSQILLFNCPFNAFPIQSTISAVLEYLINWFEERDFVPQLVSSISLECHIQYTLIYLKKRSNVYFFVLINCIFSIFSPMKCNGIIELYFSLAVHCTFIYTGHMALRINSVPWETAASWSTFPYQTVG